MSVQFAPRPEGVIGVSSICPETCERHLGAIFSTLKSLSEDAIRTPSKMDGSPLPGAQEGDSTSLKWGQGVGSSGDRGPLADDDGPGLGPGIEPRGIGGFTAVVGGQHQVNRLGLGLGDQFDETQLIKVAGEQKVPTPRWISSCP